MMRGRDRGDPADEAPITSEDIAWRIGASSDRPGHQAPASEPPDAAAPAAAAGGPGGAGATDTPPTLGQAARDRVSRRGGSTVHARSLVSGPTRRRVLWRDASALLFATLVVVLAAQLLAREPGDSTASLPSDIGLLSPSQVALAATATPGQPDATIGPVIDPSLIPGIEATSTPRVTPRPSPTAAPIATPRRTPRPSIAPGATPNPTPGPTAPPQPTPPPPAPTPVPTPAPPVAVIQASPSTCGDAPFTVTFDGAGSIGATSYEWDFSDGTPIAAAPTVSHTFEGPGDYDVTLRVFGPGGSDSTSVPIKVPCA